MQKSFPLFAGRLKNPLLSLGFQDTLPRRVLRRMENDCSFTENIWIQIQDIVGVLTLLVTYGTQV